MPPSSDSQRSAAVTVSLPRDLPAALVVNAKARKGQEAYAQAREQLSSLRREIARVPRIERAETSWRDR